MEKYINLSKGEFKTKFDELMELMDEISWSLLTEVSERFYPVVFE